VAWVGTRIGKLGNDDDRAEKPEMSFSVFFDNRIASILKNAGILAQRSERTAH
jgi:hypothetical protein